MSNANAVSTVVPFILFVDDDLDAIEVLGWFAKRWDFDTEAVSNGREALSLAATKHPDLIVLDVMMPEMNGFEVLDALKSDIKTAHIPVILLTAGPADEEFRTRGRQKGACEYLVKPVNPYELMSRINYHLNRHSHGKETTLVPRIPDDEKRIERRGILIVEDDLNLLETLENVVEGFHPNVLVARNAFEALGILRDKPGQVAVMLTDLRMPDMNGMALVKRTLLLYPDIKILVMSADVASFQREIDSLGRPIETIHKPIDLNVLRQNLTGMLELAKGT